MNCTKAQRIISLVIDGEASEQQRRLLDFHLMGCSACRKAMEMSMDISRISHDLPAPSPPPDLESSVRAILASGADNKSKRRERRTSFLSIPAVAALIILVFTILPGSSGREQLQVSSPAGFSAGDHKNVEIRLASKSGIRTAPLSEYSRQASLVSF